MRSIGNWEMARIIGYVPITKYWDRLKDFGDNTSEEVEKIFEESKTNYRALTEFVMVLNHLCWAYHDMGEYEISEWYANKYYKYHEWAYSNLKDEELRYYFRTTD